MSRLENSDYSIDVTTT